ncbi:adenylosuccinate lyase [Anopheles sinensis]|uniref:Adenylosuccinate lyase n=1 Tax=Anopheles sinensis TaxID=74873 RepID=A0A084VPD0_ANOSI|nr:adenylosuccinate lyase [Anopheles sinensis]
MASGIGKSRRNQIVRCGIGHGANPRLGSRTRNMRTNTPTRNLPSEQNHERVAAPVAWMCGGSDCWLCGSGQFSAPPKRTVRSAINDDDDDDDAAVCRLFVPRRRFSTLASTTITDD